MPRGSLAALVFVLGTLGGCSAETAACPEPIGVWVIRTTQTSGNCGELPPETGPLLGTAPAGSMAFLGARSSSCAGEWSATDSSTCTLHLARACPVGQTLEGDLTHAESGGADRWSGTLRAMNDGSGGFSCSSAYDLVVTRE